MANSVVGKCPIDLGNDIVVGVSRDEYGWPVFRLRDLPDTSDETAEKVAWYIEALLRGSTESDTENGRALDGRGAAQSPESQGGLSGTHYDALQGPAGKDVRPVPERLTWSDPDLWASDVEDLMERVEGGEIAALDAAVLVIGWLNDLAACLAERQADP